MIGTLNVLVLALAAYIVFDEPPVVVQRAAAQQPGQPDAAPERETKPAEVVDKVAPRAEVAGSVPGAPKAEPEAGEAEAIDVDAPRRRRGSKRHGVKPGREAEAPRTAAAPAPKEGGGDVPFDCIVDPKSCGRGANGPSTAAQGPTKKQPREDLPSTLGQSALRAGFGKVRTQAKACGPKHGVSGQQVAVKVSISGRTGAVTAARALGPHAKTALGNCVASALRRASFRPIRQAADRHPLHGPPLGAKFAALIARRRTP